AGLGERRQRSVRHRPHGDPCLPQADRYTGIPSRARLRSGDGVGCRRVSHALSSFPQVEKEKTMPAEGTEPLTIDVVSDVVCPWCFIGKRRLEQAIALKPGIPVVVRYRPYLLNPWVQREGMGREEYLTTKFGAVAGYRANAQRIVMAAREEGLTYNVDAITRQPNTIDCHRLILWSGQ